MSDAKACGLPEHSVLGRLLVELSWAGPRIRRYRNGGRGDENVLTTEVFQGLDFLPRRAFLGSVLAGAWGADVARARLIEEIEECAVTLLPSGEFHLVPGREGRRAQTSVQPDARLVSPSTFLLLEAKRIRRGVFQPRQLAREYVLALRESRGLAPLLFLVLGEKPPVKVAGSGKLAIAEATSLGLEEALEQATEHQITPAEARARIEATVCWITWQEISEIVKRVASRFANADSGVRRSVGRLASSITAAIERHDV